MRYPTAFETTLRSPLALFERFFRDVVEDRLPEAFQRGTGIPVNVAETESALQFEFELPGLEEKDIQVEVLGSQLIVTAQRTLDTETKNREYHRVEHQYGALTRTVTLPRELKTDQIQADYKNGILMVTVPKVEPTPARKIKVKSS
jgi:HSP20 family protein